MELSFQVLSVEYYRISLRVRGRYAFQSTFMISISLFVSFMMYYSLLQETSFDVIIIIPHSFYKNNTFLKISKKLSKNSGARAGSHPSVSTTVSVSPSTRNFTFIPAKAIP